MKQVLKPVSNVSIKDNKPRNPALLQPNLRNILEVQPNNDDNDEYSDPEFNDNSSTSYDSDDDVDFEGMPEVDQRNLNKPEKLAKYAETIFSIAIQDIPTTSASSNDFKNIQTEITPVMHETAVKWIFRIQAQYQMSNDALYEAVAYLNTILSKSPVRKSQLQLITVTCIWMASKIEERSVPKLEDLSTMCSNQYGADDFVKCERKLLRILDFRLSFPTSKFFLRRLLDSIDAEPAIIEVADFFCDLSLMPLEFVDFSPNVIAFAAVCLGKLCLNEFCPTLRLMAYAHMNDLEDVKKCGAGMLQYAPTILNDPKHVLYIRYNGPNTTHSVFEMNLSIDMSHALS
ncbi:cell division [Tritrichomonas musculus]|uniref:Cell division n=1 Tax=Tritrichomonas musculus TaxID=1915356 RepID=A0ABR2KDK1_9EUKA